MSYKLDPVDILCTMDFNSTCVVFDYLDSQISSLPDATFLADETTLATEDILKYLGFDTSIFQLEHLQWQKTWCREALELYGISHVVVQQCRVEATPCFGTTSQSHD